MGDRAGNGDGKGEMDGRDKVWIVCIIKAKMYTIYNILYDIEYRM